MVRQTAAAVIVFVVAAIVGVFVSGRADVDLATTTTTSPETTTTAEPRPQFVGDGETVVGPVVIVAGEPFVDSTQLVIGFDVVSLAPTADAADVVQQLGFGNVVVVPPEELNTAYLDNWLLTTTSDDQIQGRVANPSARAARFDVGEGFDPDSIATIAIESYTVLSPVSSAVELAAGSESAPVAPGVTARLLAVTEQANTIVQIELTSDRGFNLDNLRVTGSGAGWVSAVREAEGRPRWNLTYASPTAPSPIALKVEGAVWVAVDADVEVLLPEAP